MDYVTLDQFRVRGIHGCHKYEREAPQDFIVSLKVGMDLSVPGASDNLEDTLDFDFLKSAVTTAFAGERKYLIETLAEEIAAAILKDARVREITVSIQKPDVWPDAIPGVIITRSK